jgi:aminoglycoside 6'-N-acetyltransferase I
VEISVKIVEREREDQDAVQQAANLLVQGFREHWPNAWPDEESTKQEVLESLQKEYINRIAID